MKQAFNAAILAGIPLFLSYAAAAQSTPAEPETPDASQIEEVIVSGKFISAGASSAMKLDIPVRDTPFSVSSYSESFMKAIETTNVANLYSYMTGIQRAGNTGYDITFRGFLTGSTDRNAIMTDGLPGLAGRFGSPPTIGTDHIELVKGPASVLYGQAQPGGFVNIIAKKPKATRTNEIDVRGTYGEGRTKAWEIDGDFTGPVDEGRKLLYRFVFQAGNGDTFRNGGFEKPLYLAPSLTWNIDDDTSVRLAFEYRETKTSYDNYLVAPLNDIHRVAPITTRYQEPGDFLWESGRTTTLSAQHGFANGIQWNFAIRDVRHNDYSQGYDTVAVRPNLLTLQRRARQQANAREYDFADTDLVVPFSTFSIDHKAIVGLSGGRETLNANRIQFFNAPATGPQSLDISLYNPVYGRAKPLGFYPLVNPTTPSNLNDRYTKNFAKGVYLSDLLTLTPQWKLLAGVRYSEEEQQFQELRLQGVPSTDKKSNAVLPTAGLVYEPDEHWSLYTSFATSYVPPPATAIDTKGNNNFVPTSAQQEEVGVKSNFLNGRIEATLAWYHIEKQNVINSFACPLGTCSSQQGGALSQGEEFELNAQPVQGWQVTFGYAHMNARITQSNDPAQIDARLTNAPRNNWHMWSRYDFGGGPLEGWGGGLGLSYVGDRAGTLPTSADRSVLKLPTYITTDVGIYFLDGPYDFTFKITNLFNRTYYESAGFTGNLAVFPGAPRTAMLSTRIHF